MDTWIALSGGVDSSAAAYLMKLQFPDGNHRGVMLRLSEGKAGDEADAAAVCDKLSLPFDVIDARAPFEEEVIRDFVRVYEAGGTPNPCVVCNRRIKFGFLLDEAVRAGAEKLVSGHYARVGFDAVTGRMTLSKALDSRKDQSYMLYGLSQKQLAHLLLPLGAYTKEEARALAEGAGLITAHKSDSQDICFIPDGDYAGFLERYTQRKPEPGLFVTPEGKVIGPHKGIIHYTVGQRKGLGIASSAPFFVTEIRPKTNEVVLSHGEGLFTRGVSVGSVNWVSVSCPAEPVRVNAKLRYRHTPAPALLIPEDGGRVSLCFDEPQRAVTPGQSAVFYDGDLVLGGGIIQ